jgi:hypothetical protein
MSITEIELSKINIEKLRAEIELIVRNDSVSIYDLKDVLSPVFDYIEYPAFAKTVNEIVDIVLEDRNGDGKFDIADLKMLSTDIRDIGNLIGLLVVLLQYIPKLKLKYQHEITELLVFKVLVYMFMVVIPEKANIVWSIDNKVKILDIITHIYKVITQSKLVKDIIERIIQWFKDGEHEKLFKRVFKCCYPPVDKTEEIIAEHLPIMKEKLRSTLITCNRMNILSNAVNKSIM